MSSQAPICVEHTIAVAYFMAGFPLSVGGAGPRGALLTLMVPPASCALLGGDLGRQRSTPQAMRLPVSPAFRVVASAPVVPVVSAGWE